MEPEQKKAAAEADIEALEIKLARIPVENLAEVTETLDRVRVAAQKLVGKIAEAADKYAAASDQLDSRNLRSPSDIARNQLENISTQVGKALNMLDQGMRIVLSAAAAKEKLNSGK
jgi:hypothetical protein